MRHHKFRVFILLLFTTLAVVSRAQIATAPAAPSLPESQILVPVLLDLKPIYALAEKSVGKVFTSPNYPHDWIQADCATRYKYHFRRSPLQMKTSGTSMTLSFIGYYQMVGSTRACVKGRVLSPWTPACSCGFEEGERKVAISFSSYFAVTPSHQVQFKINRNEPKALDKCTVCFWGQYITTQVLDGLKTELDAAKKSIQDSFGIINTRPYMQQAWNKLNAIYLVPGIGYLSLHPKKLHMEKITATNDLLNMNIGITATPVISFERPAAFNSQVPNLSPSGRNGGFSIFLDAQLNYDSLTNVVNGYMKGKRFDIKEAMVKKHVVVNSCRIAGNSSGQMIIEVDFSGSHNGSVNFVGKPVYNPQTKSIEIAGLNYDLQTKDFLLKTAKWLFDKKIISELKKFTNINLTNYYDTAAKALTVWLNKEWAKGIKSSGNVADLKLVDVMALPQHLYIQTACTGQLRLMIDDLMGSF